MSLWKNWMNQKIQENQENQLNLNGFDAELNRMINDRSILNKSYKI